MMKYNQDIKDYESQIATHRIVISILLTV